MASQSYRNMKVLLWTLVPRMCSALGGTHPCLRVTALYPSTDASCETRDTSVAPNLA